MIEESLYKHIDIPAIEYFGRRISRKEFIENVYLWAKAFKQLGVKENEVVAYYGPFMPDVCYMIFALNIIGACPYFLKLAISAEALSEETKECRIAIVFDQMWENVKDEFIKDRFKNVIIVSITDSMPALKKKLVSLLSIFKSKVNVPRDKYLSVIDAYRLANSFEGEVRAPFVPKRSAFITSSSGTTVGGIVKGTVATNESTISQLYMAMVSGTQYHPGDRCLCNFPPTASTALNCLFFMALHRGMTVMIDPRVSEKDFYNQILKYKPSIALTTGSMWEAFFNRVDKQVQKGRKIDFSFAKGWTIGGEGTDNKKFRHWKDVMFKAGGKSIYSGYGSSELFSAVSVETVKVRYDFSKTIMSVGIPYAGITLGVFDDNGKELGYNQRGALRVRSRSAMKGYYNKPDITAQTIVDGWICTGDLAEIDENGFVYIWGRVKDKIKLRDAREVYLFDISNKIKEKDFIDDAIVLEKRVGDESVNLVAHIVWDKNVKKTDIIDYLQEINESIRQFEPAINLCAYSVHDTMLPYSPTTLKKDKNKMAEQTEGFIQVINGEVKSIQFIKDKNDYYSMKTT